MTRLQDALDAARDEAELSKAGSGDSSALLRSLDAQLRKHTRVLQALLARLEREGVIDECMAGLSDEDRALLQQLLSASTSRPPSTPSSPSLPSSNNSAADAPKASPAAASSPRDEERARAAAEEEKRRADLLAQAEALSAVYSRPASSSLSSSDVTAAGESEEHVLP